MRAPWTYRATMERFVGMIIAGGVSLVAGLWVLRLFEAGSPAWLAGAALVVLGATGLAAGIASEIEYR